MLTSNSAEDSFLEPKVSAFPKLTDDISELPLIPGGWKTEVYQIDGRELSIFRPADPDQFLDDPDVLSANQSTDYMPFWAFLWPAAVKMASAIKSAPWKPGSSLLELGAGLGLVGLSAMQRGDVVTYSDYDLTALHLCRANARKNSLPDPPVLQLDWREPIEAMFDVIVGCEVTYDAPMHSVILDLIDVMLARDGYCWLGDPGRYQSPFFYQLALDRGFQVRIFNEKLIPINVPSSEGFQIFELRQPPRT